MKKQLRQRDWQDLSAYLDGQLSSRERARLEEKLRSREDLQNALEELRRVRIMLRSQPRLRAPRNFTLGPEFASQGVGRQPFRRLSPALGLVSALASVLFILVVIGENLFGAAQPAMAPAPAEFQAKSAQVEMAASPTELALQKAPEQSVELEAEPQVTDQSMQAQEMSQQVEGGVTQTLDVPGAGMLEYPAPLARAYEEGAYPPPAVPSPTALAAQETQQLSPQPTQLALPATEAAVAQSAPEQPAIAPAAETVQSPSGFWNPWRFVQFGLLLLAIISGALAFYWRQRSR